MNLVTFRPEVALHIKGAEPSLLDHYILRGAINFLKRAEAWQVTDEVEIAPNSDSFIVPEVVTGDFHKLVSIEIIDRVIKGEDLNRFCKASLSGEVKLAQKTEGAVTIKVTSVYVPKANATVIDEAIGREYRDSLIDAALDKLYLLPRYPWTDAGQSAFHRAHWEEKADKAKRLIYTTGQQAGPIRTKTRFLNGR